MCRKIDILKWITRCGWLALLLSLAGCAADFHSSLFSLHMALTPPHTRAEQEVPVIYPDEEGQQRAAGGADSLAEAYGPAWQDLQPRYPDYRFNWGQQ